MKSRLKELKDNHEFRKGEGWEITTLPEDIDWLIEQAERVERYEKALKWIVYNFNSDVSGLSDSDYHKQMLKMANEVLKK
jgi:hypothetical protein